MARKLSKPVSPRGDEIPPEIDEKAQPGDEDGVMEDMATLAINPRLLENLEAAETPSCRGDFGQMDDAAIMLELRTGNMAGFDFLIQKYRKPIIHFMYRMVRNQAVAEELAQEVFLRVYRSRETYRAEARFSTWLYRIATNLGVNYARDTRHERDGLNRLSGRDRFRDRHNAGRRGWDASRRSEFTARTSG